ncbi:MAG TPA: tyrosine-type recombinase/integrase [Thermoleophilaceae bacterium]|nr:tyrosine-type recombinase/integrase [Thermoleophilaceae bacterium]
MATVERPRLARRAGIDVFSREEVMALVDAAFDEQDGILYLTAAFTGLRIGELLGLRWEDVDFDLATVLVCDATGAVGGRGLPRAARVERCR